MKRHEALHPLSRDHHDVLVHARRLRGLDKRFDAESARDRFLSYAPILLMHFDEEEQALGPRIGEPGLRRRLLEEHADLRRRTAALPTASAAEQAALGEALRLHIRFEEDELFPALESSLPPDRMAEVAAAGGAFRAERRPSSLTGEEACFL